MILIRPFIKILECATSHTYSKFDDKNVSIHLFYVRFQFVKFVGKRFFYAGNRLSE